MTHFREDGVGRYVGKRTGKSQRVTLKICQLPYGSLYYKLRMETFYIYVQFYRVHSRRYALNGKNKMSPQSIKRLFTQYLGIALLPSGTICQRIQSGRRALTFSFHVLDTS